MSDEIDTELLGDASFGLLESFSRLPVELQDRKLIAVGIVAVVVGETPEGDMSFIRVYCTEKIHHRAVGLFQVALSAYDDDMNAPLGS